MDLELITTSGYGKNGALTFLQRTVRPQIVTTFQLPGIREAWTVRGPLNSDNVRKLSIIDIKSFCYVCLKFLLIYVREIDKKNQAVVCKKRKVGIYNFFN